jgi:hypothetical protein
MSMKAVCQVALLSLLGLLTASCATQSSAAIAQRAELESEMKVAIEKVQFLVNQPVEPLLRVEGMQVSTYKPGWFHEGASKPDYNNVDIRRTQDLSYGKNEYVTSDLNPGIVFRGAEVEFNSMTKFFYTDRSTPPRRD